MISPTSREEYQLEEEFDIDQLLQHEAKLQRIEEPDVIESRLHSRFLEICNLVKGNLSQTIEINDGSGSTTNEKWLDRQHRAVIGDSHAVDYFIEEIQKVLSDKHISFQEYPSFYSNLAEAIFHEVWGLSILAKWEKYENSEAALIHGVSLWIDFGDGKGFVRQKEQFTSKEAVERVKRAFIHRREDSILNRENPELEIEREDGSRITMIQSPRSRTNYVMLRRFVVDKFTLEEQAERGTIPFEDIRIYRAIARTLANVIVAGRVRSAKSTFLKTLIGERPKNMIHVVLEKHFELYLGKHFPDRLSFEFQAKEGDLHKVIPSVLRMEHDALIVGEIRSLEIEAYLQSTERGERGAMSTYHLTEDKRAVDQLARHTLDEFPSRRFEIEVERVANAVDLIITMSSDRDRKKKRVTGVSEITWDSENRTYRVTELIKYSPLTTKYYYNANVSNGLLQLMAHENLPETILFRNLLQQRAEVSPMDSYPMFKEFELENEKSKEGSFK